MMRRKKGLLHSSRITPPRGWLPRLGWLGLCWLLMMPVYAQETVPPVQQSGSGQLSITPHPDTTATSGGTQSGGAQSTT